MEKQALELFLRYAFPCAQVLLKRGTLSQEDYDMVALAVMGGKLTKPISDLFPVAVTMLRVMTGKKLENISVDEIREYFLHRHDAIVEQRAKEFNDVDIVACKVRKAKVIKTGEKLVVEGGQELKKLFPEPVKEGDTVSVHYDCACELIK